MAITVRVPTVLRPLTQGAAQIAVAEPAQPDTLGALIARLNAEYPGLRDRLLDPTGDPRSFVNLYVNGEDVRFLDGLATPLQPGDEVSIVPAAAGGSR